MTDIEMLLKQGKEARANGDKLLQAKTKLALWEFFFWSGGTRDKEMISYWRKEVQALEKNLTKTNIKNDI